MIFHSSRRLAVSLRATALLAAMTVTGVGAQPSTTDKQLASLVAEHKWNDALTLIDGQLKAKPNDPQLLMNKGTVLSSMNRSGEALAIFQAVATAHPQLPAAHNNMAVILAANGKYEDARVALEKAIRTHPAYATAYENLGDLYSHMAGDAYRKALQFDKNLKTAKPKLELVSELTASMAANPSTLSSATGRVAQAPMPAGSAPASRASAPAPAPVAQAPASTPAAVPKPAPAIAAAAPTPAPAAATTGTLPGEVRSALEAWAEAWSRRDMKAYAAAYTADFKGSHASHAEWLKARSAVIAPRKSIAVKVSDIKVGVKGDRAEVSFRQEYESDGRSVRSRKSIVMQKVGDKWLIQEESGR